MNPRCIYFNIIHPWVQIYELRPWFISEKIIIEARNKIGTFVSSCPNYVKVIWRECMRVQVTIDLSKSVKPCMMVRQTGNEKSWINFKYKNVLIFLVLFVG